MPGIAPKASDLSYNDPTTSQSPLWRRCARRYRRCRRAISDRCGCTRIADRRSRRGAYRNRLRTAQPVAAATASTAKAESENRQNERCTLHDRVSVLSGTSVESITARAKRQFAAAIAGSLVTKLALNHSSRPTKCKSIGEENATFITRALGL